MDNQNTCHSLPGIEKLGPRFKSYKKVGGFLMFAVIVCYIAGVRLLVNAVLSIVGYSNYVKSIEGLEILDIYSKMKTAYIVFMLIAIVLMLVGAYVLIKIANKIRERDSGLLRYVQLSSLIMCALGVIAAVMFLILVSEYSVLFLWIFALFIVLWAAVFVIGLVYFPRSERVAVFMGSDDYLRESLFSKNAVYPIAKYKDEVEEVLRREAEEKKKNMPVYDKSKNWLCPACGMINDNSLEKCSSCDAMKPLGAVRNRWRCKKCGRINLGTIDACKCGADREKDGVLVGEEE